MLHFYFNNKKQKRKGKHLDQLERSTKKITLKVQVI